jgi:hypothetical protein
MARLFKYVLLAALLLFLVSIPLAMQTEEGSLMGVVSDERGPVVNAMVEARNVMSGAMTQTFSDVQGRYSFPRLHAGRYSLWVRAEAHNSVWIPRVVVERGQVTREDVRLNLTAPPTVSTLR